MADAQSALMDRLYRRQRLFYDPTRKFFLLGRDHLLRQLDPKPDAHILEIACGTGRNLQKIARRYPGRHLYGLDISREMLRTARAKLGSRARLAEGDACGFAPGALFDQPCFDRVVMSYCLSMIPDWEAAIAEALRHLSPNGALHIVDFGDQRTMPRWFDRLLRRGLTSFHVTPRDDLAKVLNSMPNFEVQYQPLMGSYAQYARIARQV